MPDTGLALRSVPMPALLAGGPGPAPAASEATFVVADEGMRRLHRMAIRAAAFPVPVLILGETGSGKEVLAEVVHRGSPRAAGRFLKINCAAIAPTLVESELFGHERGAFTGAGQVKPGLLETADGGSALLDEVAELPLASQAKLLRVLETGEVTRVGATRARRIDVRFMFATNQDLDAAMAAGSFRRDLFFRISMVTLCTPPLRRRHQDIVPLARHFLGAAATQLGTPADLHLTAAAEAALLRHEWPGNVRELRNVMFRAAVLATDRRIDACDLGLAAARTDPPVTANDCEPAADGEADGERERIANALRLCGGNQRRAAARLGMSLRTLVRRLRAHGLPRPRLPVP